MAAASATSSSTGNGVYAFVTLVRGGDLRLAARAPPRAGVVLALFLGAGAAGALVASAVYPFPLAQRRQRRRAGAAGGVGGARPARGARGRYYEGDLLGAGAIAALLLAMPFALAARPAGWPA